MRPFFHRLLSYWKSFLVVVGGGLLPYLAGLARDTIVGEAISRIWLGLGGPTTVDELLGVMSRHPIQSASIATLAWVAISAWRSERYVKASHIDSDKKQPTGEKEKIEHDRDAPKRFSVFAARELLRKGRDASPRERKSTLDPQIGLWMEVEGPATSIEDDHGDDGLGGRWAGFDVNVAEHLKGNVLPEMPLVYRLLFYGEDAKVVRALPEGATVKAVGRIKSLEFGFGASILCPCELVSYASPADSGVERSLPTKQRINRPQPLSGAPPRSLPAGAGLAPDGTIAVELTWGGSMRIVGVSDSADMLAAVKCTLIDARLYLPKHGWVAAEDTHANGEFRQQLEVGKVDMYCQQPVSFGSLANEHHRLSIQGNRVVGGGVDHCRITLKGTRRLEFTLQDSAGRTSRAYLCFQWLGEGHAPEAIKCSDVAPLPPPVHTESLGR